MPVDELLLLLVLLRKLQRLSLSLPSSYAADPDCYEDADEEIEFIKVQKTRVVHIQHVKHCIDLVLAEVCYHTHEDKELDV